MNIIELENSIVGQLSPLADVGVEVIAVPETQAEFNRAVQNRITVAYSGGRVGESSQRSLADTQQNFGAMIDVTIQSRKLRGESGIYALDQAVRGRLLGFRPANAGKMRVESVAFQSLEENLWSYTLTFIAPTVFVEVDEETSLAYCTRISTITPEEGTILVVE